MTDTEKFKISQDFIKRDELAAIIETMVIKTVDARLSNGWGKYAEYVTSAITELKAGQDEVLSHCNKLEVSLQVLKTEMKIKSGLWGAVAGVITVVFAIVMFFLQGIIKP